MVLSCVVQQVAFQKPRFTKAGQKPKGQGAPMYHEALRVSETSSDAIESGGDERIVVRKRTSKDEDYGDEHQATNRNRFIPAQRHYVYTLRSLLICLHDTKGFFSSMEAT